MAAYAFSRVRWKGRDTIFAVLLSAMMLPGTVTLIPTYIDGHMLFGMTGRQCQTTMVNGKILMRDRVFTEIDEEAVNARILESSKRLWGRLNKCQY